MKIRNATPDHRLAETQIEGDGPRLGFTVLAAASIDRHPPTFRRDEDRWRALKSKGVG
ncbi:MAG: hypothetical protein ACR2QF_04095 [Geminicoccaceae bacterium]